MFNHLRSDPRKSCGGAKPDEDYHELAIVFADRARREGDPWLARAYAQLAAGYAALARWRDRPHACQHAA